MTQPHPTHWLQRLGRVLLRVLRACAYSLLSFWPVRACLGMFIVLMKYGGLLTWLIGLSIAEGNFPPEQTWGGLAIALVAHFIGRGYGYLLVKLQG